MNLKTGDGGIAQWKPGQLRNGSTLFSPENVLKGGRRAQVRASVSPCPIDAVALGLQVLAYVSQVLNVELAQDAVDHQSLSMDQVPSDLSPKP